MCGGVVWLGGGDLCGKLYGLLCGGAGGSGVAGCWLCGSIHTIHTSHQMVQAYTHHCLQYSQQKGDSPLPSHQLPPVLPLSPMSPSTAAAR